CRRCDPCDRRGSPERELGWIVRSTVALSRSIAAGARRRSNAPYLSSRSGLSFSNARVPSPMPLTRDQIVQRAAKELRDGYIVNLGIGMPTLVANYVPPGVDVWLQSENGLLGSGPFPPQSEVDADLINAGKQTVTARTAASLFP